MLRRVYTGAVVSGCVAERSLLTITMWFGLGSRSFKSSRRNVALLEVRRYGSAVHPIKIAAFGKLFTVGYSRSQAERYKKLYVPFVPLCG